MSILNKVGRVLLSAIHIAYVFVFGYILSTFMFMGFTIALFPGLSPMQYVLIAISMVVLLKISIEEVPEEKLEKIVRFIFPNYYYAFVRKS